MSTVYSDFIRLLPIGNAVEVDYCTRSGQSIWRALFLGNLTECGTTVSIRSLIISLSHYLGTWLVTKSSVHIKTTVLDTSSSVVYVLLRRLS